MRSTLYCQVHKTLGSMGIVRFGEYASMSGFKLSESKQQFSEGREEDCGLLYVNLQISSSADSGGNRFLRFHDLEGNKTEMCDEPG
jgi:hypothetical protein